MAVTLQFVDKIDAAPTVRLDLNAGVWSLQLNGTDFGFPELDRAIVSTLLTDGAQIPASAYGLRTLTLRFLVDESTPDANATAQQLLYRELNRANNILKFAPNTTAPVFFRTFRSSPENVETIRDGSDLFLVVRVLAEPFAYGLKETPVSGATINTDPAAASNPCYIDVTGVKGDVETPTLVKFRGAAGDRILLLATRRRGTPSATPFLHQCEAFTQGTDTTTQANDAAMSGSGNNFSRCTFATSTMQTRLTKVASAFTASVDLRGRYRVFLRYRKSVAGDAINVRLGWGLTGGTASIFNTTAATASTTVVTLLDLGDIQIPQGFDPVYDGVSGSELVAVGNDIRVQAERTSGTGNLDFDFLLFVPSDQETGIVKFPNGGSDAWVLDAASGNVHNRSVADAVVSDELAEVSSPGWPHLSPAQTNRIFVVYEVNPGLPYSITQNLFGWDISYWPRYLYVRPPTT